MHCEDPIQTIFKIQKILDKPAVDIPDDFLDFELSPLTNFSQPIFDPIVPVTTLSTNLDFSNTDASPIISPLSSALNDTSSAMTDDQLAHDLKDFIQHKLQTHKAYH